MISQSSKYGPKKKVIHSSAKKRRGNIVGCFFSRKMDCLIQYHSFVECIFYYHLELNFFVQEYFVQPVEIPVFYKKDDGSTGSWDYVPDVLVFYKDGQEKLCEIKYSLSDIDEMFLLRKKAAEVYCMKQGWEYVVKCPRDFGSEYINNLIMLIKYTHAYPELEKYKSEILSVIGERGGSVIGVLANEVAVKTDSKVEQVLPHIFHLIAICDLTIDFESPIDIDSTVCLLQQENQ